MKLILLLLLLAAVFLPEELAIGWHLLHGDSARYRDWKIPVPAGWYAVHRGEGLAVERMLRMSFWRGGPAANFLPMHFTRTFHFDYDVFRDEQAKILARNGYQPSGERSIRAAGQEGRCWEFTRLTDSSNVWIACVVPAEFLSADFRGTRAYIPDFYSFFSRVERISPRAPPPSQALGQ